MKKFCFVLMMFVSVVMFLPSCSKAVCPTYKGSLPFHTKKRHMKKKGNEPWKGNKKQKKGKKGKGDTGVVPGG